MKSKDFRDLVIAVIVVAFVTYMGYWVIGNGVLGDAITDFMSGLKGVRFKGVLN